MTENDIVEYTQTEDMSMICEDTSMPETTASNASTSVAAPSRASTNVAAQSKATTSVAGSSAAPISVSSGEPATGTNVPSRLRRKRKNEAAELGTILQNTLSSFNVYMEKKSHVDEKQDSSDVLFGKVIANELSEINDPVKKRNIKCQILQIFNKD